MKEKPKLEDCRRIWNAALLAPLGVVIVTDDRKLLKQQLYKAREMLGNPDLKKFSIHVHEEDGVLFIVNTKEAQAADGEST